MLPVTATIDHGWHVSKLMRAFREYLANPEQFEPRIGTGNHVPTFSRAWNA